ncbi:MAG: hypothetical protein VXZ62_00935, partial [Pseudomonadota bacterium]|nr:hypothetical protein [Pseudomonadota bacterium]
MSFDVLQSKFVSVIDSNLYSGSSDLFRNSVGGYFENTLNENNEPVNPPAFVGMESVDNMNENIYIVQSYAGGQINENIDALLNLGIATEVDDDVPEEFGTVGYLARSQNTILPYTRFVTHLQADPEHDNFQDPMVGNKYWRCLFTGEPFDGKVTKRIYDNLIFDQHYTSINLPYSKFDEKTFSKGSSLNKVCEIGYNYLNYNKIYQNSIIDLESEKLAPNLYIT